MAQGRSIAGPITTLLMLGVAGAFYAYLNIDSYATKIVNQKLTESTVGTRFVARVGAARVVENSGLEIRDFELRELGKSRSPLLSISRIMVRVPTAIKELISKPIKPQSVEIQKLQLDLDWSRIDQGFWEEIAEIVERNQTENPEDFPLAIRESTIAIRDGRSGIGAKLTDFNADVRPVNSGQQIEVVAKSNGDRIREIATRVLFDKQSKRWIAELKRLEFPIDNQIVAMLPADIRSRLPNLQAAGQLGIKGVVKSARDGSSTPEFNLQCELANFQAQTDAFPLPVSRCNSQATITNQKVLVSRATGKLGQAKFDIAYEQAGLKMPANWQAIGTVDGLRIDSSLAKYFPGKSKRLFDDFSPSTETNFRFKLDSNGNRDITAKLKDLSFAFYKFPYQIEQCEGMVHWTNDALNFNFSTLEQGQKIEFDGKVRNPGKHSTFTIGYRTLGKLPIGQKMLDSLREQPTLQRIVNDFRPSGHISSQGSFRKTRPTATTIVRDISVQLHDCSTRYEHFEYPMEAVNGQIQMDNDSVAFRGITGENSNARASCNGGWDEKNGLQLVFQCDRVPLDSQLRHAFSSEIQAVWDVLRPAGTIHSAKAYVSYPEDTKELDVRIQANLNDLQGQHSDTSDAPEIRPTWFPYRIQELKGEVEIGDGVVTCRNLLGRHDQTWISCQASGKYSRFGWFFHLDDMLARSVSLDHELLKALPTRLSTAIETIDFQGQVNVSGDMTFAQNNQVERLPDDPASSGIQQVGYGYQPGALNSSWDLRLDMDQAKMLIGIPVENVFGSVRFAGRDSGNKSECSGQVAIDSLSVYGLQVTNVHGPIWIDDNQTLAGRFARSNDSSQEASPLKGDLFGGTVLFDGMVSHSDDFPFKVQATVEKTRLEDLAAEVAPQFGEMSGDGYAFMQLTGNSNEQHTYKGKGNLHLRDAKIHQLPVILSLLKILSVKEPNRTAFDSSNVDFSIKGEQIKFDRIELIGDAISLIGNGYMELFRHADMNFYSIMGRNRLYIPLLSELYRAGSQRVLWINIGGPLNNLQTSRRVLPGLDDGLRSLIDNGRNGNGSGSGNGSGIGNGQLISPSPYRNSTGN